MTIHDDIPPPVEQRRLNKRNPKQPSQTSYWHPVYRGYPIYQDITLGPQVLDHLDRAFERLRSLQHRHSQVFACRVDLRFPVDLDDPALYADNQPIRDFLKSFTKEVRALSGQREPALYVLWAREHNDQTRRRHVTDADRQDGEADLTRPHYHLLIAVNRDDFYRLGGLKPSYDGHYGDRSLAHAAIRSWQRVLGRASDAMRGIVHFAKCPETGKIQTFVIRRSDGPEGLIAPMKAASYLCKAYSKDTGKRLRTFQTGRIPPDIRDAIWRQERHRQEPVEAAECYQPEHRGCTTLRALDTDTLARVRHWLLQPALLIRTGASSGWQRLDTPDITDLHLTWAAEGRVKQLVGFESHQALETSWVRTAQRGTPRGQAVVLHKVLTPAWRFLEVDRREAEAHRIDGTRRVYDRTVDLYRQTFQPLASRLHHESAREVGALKHHPDRQALYEALIEGFYRLRGQLARPNIRALVVKERRALAARGNHYATEVEKLLARESGLQVVMLQVGHDPLLFPQPGDLTLAHSQQALHTLLDGLADSPVSDALVGLFWKRDHGLARQHVIHLVALYRDPAQSVEQRSEAMADHWIHGITRGEGVAYRVLPTRYNTEHLLTPDLRWLTAGDATQRDALRQRLQGVFLMDRLTHLALPGDVASHGWVQPGSSPMRGR
ncbi:MAG: YagK/YfjJ domain-containing protein [Pseudomonadota bacterium]